MCIQTRISKILAEKAALDAQMQKLELLAEKTAPIKNLLTELLEDYAAEAPEDLAALWGEILAIGGKFNLSVQPLAADELRQWEADRAALEQLRLDFAKYQADFKDSFWAEVEAAKVEILTGAEYDAAVEEELALDDDRKDIPALTLWQPWASLIQQEIKRIETRSWSTNYRGPIAIHAAKKPVNISDYPGLFELLPDNCEIPLGAVVAIANLVDCVEMTPEFIAQQSETELMCGDWLPGRFAWVLEIIRPVVPAIAATGGQKLWNWSGTSIAAELEYLEKFKATPEPEYELEESAQRIFQARSCCR
ncbi:MULTISPECIES: ASCH domain-containing protein [unclassified Microcoleus]|uniref:ASCH domain-containing protein n=1 Tax=unclassified Microcoleus TaxID=2642155 RepID=UPI002FD4BBFD